MVASTTRALSASSFAFQYAFLTMTPRPNHAMERTADRCALHLSDDFHISTPRYARSPPPSLILFSLDAEAAPMNKAYVLWNLKEARGALDELNADMQADADYDYG